MEYFQYLVEFMGTLVLIYAFLLTDTNPTIMAIVYFAIHTLADEYATGTFNPFGCLAYYMIGRMSLNETIYNLVAQLFAMQAAVVTFLPAKAFIGDLY